MSSSSSQKLQTAFKKNNNSMYPFITGNYFMDYAKLKRLNFCISCSGEWEFENSFSKIIIN